MHLGNVRTALFNWLLARATGGRFLLRVEDTDAARSEDRFLQALLEDLAWLGIDWDAGPDREDELGPYRQSLRGLLHGGLLARLEQAGSAYPCFCSTAELEVARRTQAAAGDPPRYPGTCRGLSAEARMQKQQAGRQPVLRFRVPDATTVTFDDLVRGTQSVESSLLGDFVLSRPDGTAMFFFVNAVDDALMGVSAVLRGEDHLSNTARQLLVLQALGLQAPRYGHLPLLLGTDGVPLSKRAGSLGLAELRERGYLPAAVANYLLRLGHAGAPDEWVEAGAMAGAFDLTRLGRAPAHFDSVQLDHWQREAVKRLSPADALAWLGSEVAVVPAQQRDALVELLRHNVLFPEQVAPWLAILCGDLPAHDAEARQVLADAGADFFAAAARAYQQAGADLGALTRELKRSTQRKGAALFMPLRIALTGRHDGPELALILSALSREQVERRLAQAAGERGAGA